MDDARNRVMIVDGDNTNLAVLSQILSPEFDLVTAMNGHDALKRAEGTNPDLILLNIALPDMSGFDALRELKSSETAKAIPVIIISGGSKPDAEEKAFLLGAVDYVVKPFNNTIVMARAKTHLRTVLDMRKIERLSMADAATGMPSRYEFESRLALEWKRAIREKKALSLLIVDVDGLGEYNKAYGEGQGDEMLRAVFDVLSQNARRPADLPARLSGGEFGVLLPDTSWESALLISENIRKTVKATILPTMDGNFQTGVTVSIGLVTRSPKVGDEATAYFGKARESMFEAKNAGRDRIIGKVL